MSSPLGWRDGEREHAPKKRGAWDVPRRHVLLPQPGGFEGFASGPEYLYARDSRAAEAVDTEGVAFGRGAARSAKSVNAASGQDPWVGVQELKQVGAGVIESLLGGGEMSPDLLDPVMHRRTGKLRLIVPLDIWIEELSREIPCLFTDPGSPVPESEQATDQLDVLLRHRPRSIS